MIPLETLCREVTALSEEVGRFILAERKTFDSSAVRKKGHNDLVSYVDKHAEKWIVERLGNLLPESGFIAEEDGTLPRSEEYNWIVDPLDGTTNFIHGIPCFCISIALVKHNELQLGVVHELNFDECFYAWKGGGAYMNEQMISVSDIDSMSDSLLATGFPYHNYDRMADYMKVFEHCMRYTHGLRRLGSAAADLAYVACGRCEGFYEYGLKPWDVAAGALIVMEAGGQVNDFAGGTNFIFGEELVATNGKITHELLSVLAEKFSGSKS